MRRRWSGEEGFTLIELLVASAMSIVLLAGTTTVLVGALRAQPRVSEGAAQIQQARWVLERMTRELRQGVEIYGTPNASSVAFETYVHSSTCGAATTTAASRQCAVTYECASEACTRTEVAPPAEGHQPAGGTANILFEGISNGGAVFCYVPSAGDDPSECGAPSTSTPPTYVGVTLSVANPEGGAALTVSDGATLRGATLGEN